MYTVSFCRGARLRALAVGLFAAALAMLVGMQTVEAKGEQAFEIEVSPRVPIAGESAAINVRMVGGTETHDASERFQLKVMKVRQAPRPLFVSYLPRAVVFQSQLPLSRERQSVSTVFWDEGGYLITAVGEGGSAELAVDVATPPAKIRATAALAVLLLLAGGGSGFLIGRMRRTIDRSEEAE